MCVRTRVHVCLFNNMHFRSCLSHWQNMPVALTAGVFDSKETTTAVWRTRKSAHITHIHAPARTMRRLMKDSKQPLSLGELWFLSALAGRCCLLYVQVDQTKAERGISGKLKLLEKNVFSVSLRRGSALEAVICWAGWASRTRRAH